MHRLLSFTMSLAMLWPAQGARADGPVPKSLKWAGTSEYCQVWGKMVDEGRGFKKATTFGSGQMPELRCTVTGRHTGGVNPRALWSRVTCVSPKISAVRWLPLVVSLKRCIAGTDRVARHWEVPGTGRPCKNCEGRRFDVIHYGDEKHTRTTLSERFGADGRRHIELRVDYDRRPFNDRKGAYHGVHLWELPDPWSGTSHAPFRIPNGDFFAGPANAPVSVVIFGSYEDIHTARLFRQISKWPKKVKPLARFAFRHQPHHRSSNAKAAAIAATCAGNQGKFPQAHQALIAGVGDISKVIQELPQRLKLDRNAYTRCLTGAGPKAVAQHMSEAKKLRLAASPAIFVNDRLAFGVSKNLPLLILGEAARRSTANPEARKANPFPRIETSATLGDCALLLLGRRIDMGARNAIQSLGKRSRSQPAQKGWDVLEFPNTGVTALAHRGGTAAGKVFQVSFSVNERGRRPYPGKLPFGIDKNTASKNRLPFWLGPPRRSSRLQRDTYAVQQLDVAVTYAKGSADRPTRVTAALAGDRPPVPLTGHCGP